MANVTKASLVANMIGSDKMKKVVDECVGCSDPQYRNCWSCGLKNVEIEVCDECGSEDEKLFNIDGDILCETCALHCILDNYSVEELVEALEIGGVVL